MSTKGCIQWRGVYKHLYGQYSVTVTVSFIPYPNRQKDVMYNMFSSISSKEGNEPTPPRALILNIEGDTDHSCLKIAVDQNQKSSLFCYSIECYIVQKTKPVAWLSSTPFSGHFNNLYAYIYMHYRLFIYYFKFHHCRFTSL